MRLPRIKMPKAGRGLALSIRARLLWVLASTGAMALALGASGWWLLGAGYVPHYEWLLGLPLLCALAWACGGCPGAGLNAGLVISRTTPPSGSTSRR